MEYSKIKKIRENQNSTYNKNEMKSLFKSGGKEKTVFIKKKKKN